jgi:hypothetical protein
MPGYVKVILAIVSGVLSIIVAFGASYFIDLDEPKRQTFTIISIITVASIVIGILMRAIEYLGKDDNEENYSVGDIFIRALYMPLMVGLMLVLFAGAPVLMGILPPRFQSYPGEGMGILGIFRGIPESMSPIVGEESLPIAEMFYAFWGALYGMTIV